MSSIEKYLQKYGPTRSSVISNYLVKIENLTPEAARKRLSRIKPPLHRFPIQLLPKKEHFIYHHDQRREEWFWINFLESMRSSGAIFGSSIDGLLARQGVVLEEEFTTISGAPDVLMKGQIMAKSVIDRLIRADVIERTNFFDGNTYISIHRNELGSADWKGLKGRKLAEGILLDGLREWVRKIGAASYNSIKIRGDADRKPIGPFMFDLAGPSYLLPVKSSGKQPGFLVADVFAGTTLDKCQIQYFIRKVTMLHSLLKNSGVLPVLVADGFTSEALVAGHSAGVMLATPKDLFGNRVGIAMKTLLKTLNNAAAYASTSPDRIVKLIDDLSEIEGAAGNLRGVLFELLTAYLIRKDAVSIDMGRLARDPKSGKTADIDILKFTNQQAECVAIECKGKVPGGSVSLEEAEEWVRRLPIFQAYLRSLSHLQEAKLSFELWTSGTFDIDARQYLEKEQGKRKKFPIKWKDGDGVIKISKEYKEKSITDALKEHFMKHPLKETNISENVLKKNVLRP